ncbi:MAG: response regulator [Thermodesulfobacteriota bacterium]|nr:response regulator [Thermodesulfobacteriota bacterium]
MDKQELILIIDDEKRMRESLKILLTDDGYDVETAKDGKEGIEKLNEKSFSLVIVDLVMPEGNGFQVMKYIKENLPKTLGIAITGHASLDSAVEALKNGFYDYIIKPFDFEIIKASVNRALEKIKLEQRLRKSEDMMLQSERLAFLGGLASSIAHELNNKLTPILAYADLLRNKSSIGKTEDYLNAIIDSTGKTKEIIDALLGFSRQDKPKFELIDLNKVILHAISLLRSEFYKENIEIITDLSSDLPKTMADFYQIGRVFLNILNNARQAMEGKEGGIRITSKVENNEIVCEIIDSGHGIADEYIEKIFDPFFTTKEGKTGLGLSLCYGIIMEHRGFISALCTSGTTTFRTTLPIVGGDTDIRTVNELKKPQYKMVEGLNILAVDDEDEILSIISDLFEDEFVVNTARNGQEAIEKIKQGEYSAIITDIKMPKIGGINLFKWVAENKPELCEKMIFITGNVYDSEVKQFLQEINNPWLAKPFTISDLIRMVREAVKK